MHICAILAGNYAYCRDAWDHAAHTGMLPRRGVLFWDGVGARTISCTYYTA